VAKVAPLPNKPRISFEREERRENQSRMVSGKGG
jgi:hypothetical protein